MKKFFVTFILLLSLSTVAHAKMKGKIIDCTYIAPKQSFAINIPLAFGKRVVKDGKEGPTQFLQISDDCSAIKIEVDQIPPKLECMKNNPATFEQFTSGYIERVANENSVSKPAQYKKEIIQFEDGTMAIYYEFLVSNGVAFQSKSSMIYEDIKNSILYKITGNELITISYHNVMMHNAERFIKDYGYTELAKKELIEYVNSFTHDIASIPKPKK